MVTFLISHHPSALEPLWSDWFSLSSCLPFHLFRLCRHAFLLHVLSTSSTSMFCVGLVPRSFCPFLFAYLLCSAIPALCNACHALPLRTGFASVFQALATVSWSWWDAKHYADREMVSLPRVFLNNIQTQGLCRDFQVRGAIPAQGIALQRLKRWEMAPKRLS